MIVRPLRAADIGTLAGVLNRAYHSEQNAELRLRASIDTPAFATFVAVLDGVPVGMVIGNHYGRSAYVSQMAVEPAFQRRGIATRLMDELSAWAQECRFEAVELDATTAGAPLYARYGFGAAGHTDVYASELGTAGTLAAAGTARARPYDRVERDAVFAADRVAFGADRCVVLGLLLDAMPEAVRVIGSAGRIDGYAVAQVRPQVLGPVVAPDAAAASALILAARQLLPAVHRLQIPAGNLEAAAIVASSGYRRIRSLSHMLHGTLPPGRRERLFARINLGQG